MNRIIYIIVLGLLSISSTFSQNELSLVNAFPQYSFLAPVFLTHSSDNSNRLFVVQQNGSITVIKNDSVNLQQKVYLDITERVSSGGERGLLGLAFHPQYSVNGRFFIYYTQSGTGNLIISRYNVSADPDAADKNSELILLNIPHSQYSNHNGGMLFFGNDGYLYLGTGDGGGGGDPFGNGQNKNTLLGKILRIDVNTASGGNNYSIPPDNPFAGGGGKPEIYAWGLRNPWRFTQDNLTNLIYCADVGQSKWEEIDILEKGKNYGWNIMEGKHCYEPPVNCDQTGLTLPIKEYDHQNNNCSVTGGYVYRGLNRPELTGRYIYGDYCSMNIWKLKYENGMVSEDQLLIKAPSNITSFGIDDKNELYILCQNNIIYKFSSSGNNEEPVPLDFNLEQNFPNPFNPETIIKYGIIKRSQVELNIYAASGKFIKNIVNSIQLPDNYSVTWNGTDQSGLTLPSGVYFYVLKSDESSIAKKMVLIK